MNETVTIAGLVRGREKRALTARVVRKWTVKEDSGSGQPLYVGIIIADAQGDSLYAEIPQPLINEKGPLIDVGKVYIFRKFIVGNSKTTFRAIDRELMIQISQHSVMDPAREYPPNIPEYVYRLTPFPAMEPAPKTVIDYVDAIGYITEYSELESKVPRGKERVTHLRKLYLKDLDDNVMKVTIWGDFAIDFSIDNVYNESLGNVVVCLVVGCTPKQEWNEPDTIYLSGSSPFAYYLNPPIEEASPYYTRFKNTAIHIKRPAATNISSPTMIVDKPLKLMSIAELNAIADPFNFEDGAYKCAVTITSILTNSSWWYMSCKRHKKKAVQQNDMTYKCAICNQPATYTRYSLPFMGKDESGEARFFAYDENATSIVGRDCESLMNPLGQTRGLPQQLQNIIGKRYMFSLDLSNSTIRQYIVRAVLERPSRRPVQGEEAGSSSQSPGSSSQALLTPSKPMTALRLQSPETPQNVPCSASISDKAPVSTIHSRDASPPESNRSARKNLFGQPSDIEEEESDEEAQSEDDEAQTSSETIPPKGKRAKTGAKKQGVKTSNKKSKP